MGFPLNYMGKFVFLRVIRFASNIPERIKLINRGMTTYSNNNQRTNNKKKAVNGAC